jgi:LemA protein
MGMSRTEMIAIACVAVLAFWMLGAYNRLVRLRQTITAAFALVDAQFKQRHELLSGLIDSVLAQSAGADDDAASLDAARRQARVTAERVAQRPANAGRVASLALAEQVLQGTIASVVAHAQAHASLPGSARIGELLNELTTTQHRLAAASEAFNASALDYNRSIEQFPTRLIAGLFGFRVAGTL